ncbi:MAG: hypothetical protein ACREA2_13730 [Blastocatellia bacterium]
MNGLEAKLHSLDFKSLQQIIDHALGNESALNNGLRRYLRPVAADLDKYVELLETKIPPMPKFNYPEFRHWKQSEILGTNNPELLSLTKHAFENLEKQRSDSDRWQRMRYETLFDEIVSKIVQQRSIVVRIRRELELSRRSLQEKVEKVPWKILPPGEHPFQQILAYFEEVRRRQPELHVDEDRLRKVESLKPDQRFTGEDEFDGYVVFYFNRTEMAVLESPMFGNAIYVIRGEWKSLSRKSKGELLAYHSIKVKRVVHRGDWFARLRKLIKDNSTVSKSLPKAPIVRNTQAEVVATKNEIIPAQSVINIIYTPKHAPKAYQARDTLTPLGITVRSRQVEEGPDTSNHRRRLYYFSHSSESPKIAERIAKAIRGVEEVHPHFNSFRPDEEDMESLYAIWLV